MSEPAKVEKMEISMRQKPVVVLQSVCLPACEP